ncbi:GIY-YIG nuclease family protein [Candidatus Peregrinibacteria bacterium]|nr:GIY-YIG nuclease family protein [Candidatus Peregrinibacteria bacterium]
MTRYFYENRAYYVYILSNIKRTVLYVGVTNNLERRMLEHKAKLKDGSTKKYGVQRLMYFEEYQYIGDAIYREKQLKKWRRKWKEELMEKENPLWKDLAESWNDDCIFDPGSSPG